MESKDSKHDLVLYLKGALVSVVEEHEDSHLEGGYLQYVLPCVGARYLCASYAYLGPVLLRRQRTEHNTSGTWLE